MKAALVVVVATHDERGWNFRRLRKAPARHEVTQFNDILVGKGDNIIAFLPEIKSWSDFYFSSTLLTLTEIPSSFRYIYPPINNK